MCHMSSKTDLPAVVHFAALFVAVSVATSSEWCRAQATTALMGCCWIRSLPNACHDRWTMRLAVLADCQPDIVGKPFGGQGSMTAPA